MTQLKLHPIDELCLLLQDEGYDAQREYRFADRGWRFDLALPEYRVAVEYEGGIWDEGKSGHTTGKAYQDNCHKYNEAALRGWAVLRFTANDFKRQAQGYPLALTLALLKQRGGHHGPHSLLEAIHGTE